MLFANFTKTLQKVFFFFSKVSNVNQTLLEFHKLVVHDKDPYILTSYNPYI